MKNKKPSIRQLEYFVSIAMSSNFRKAAEKLKISQPTLTSQISSLEESLESQLFERSRAGTLLSAEGRELLPIARQVLEQYQQLLDQAGNSSRELSGVFKVGVSPTIGPYLLSQVLPELHKRYPKLKMHVREAVPRQLEAGLDKGIYDFILTVLPVSSNENKVRPLFIEPINIVVSSDNSLYGKESITGKDLYNQSAINIGEHHHFHTQIALLCERYGIQVLRDFEGTSLDTVKQMAIMGMGIAFLPGLYLSSKLKDSENLQVMNLKDEVLNRTHVASWRRNSSSRQIFQKISYDIKVIAMDAFANILEEVNTDENS
ncbi:hydrogen peroxide-inducible genes activator [Gammaproteobacteria bacterium]|nr:hydrogen peroxide-inducible genes activator [Gammaproteobacteria bacterium]